jgi:hypothetical protein
MIDVYTSLGVPVRWDGARESRRGKKASGISSAIDSLWKA